MGILDRLFGIPHRIAAIAIRDYAISVQTTDLEQGFARMANVELHKYVSERIYLLCALSRYILFLRTQQRSKVEMTATGGFLERLFDEYFSTRPGVDVNVSTYHWHLAREDFLLDTDEELAFRFLVRVTDGRLARAEVGKIPRYRDLINSHIANTNDFIASATSKLQ